MVTFAWYALEIFYAICLLIAGARLWKSDDASPAVFLILAVVVKIVVCHLPEEVEE